MDKKPDAEIDAASNAGASPGKPQRLFPLAAFNGRPPDAPDWFIHALAAPHVDGEVDVEGAPIAWRRWGEPGKPGLMFVHGGVAHLGWWDFIAPFFTEAFTPAALSLSGMGASGRRDAYGMMTHAREVAAAAEAAGLFAADNPPIVVGHSFGGFVTLAAVVDHGERYRGAVICDSPIRRESRDGPRASPRRRGGRVYPNDAAALARFSLLPSQDCENLFLLDHIARGALVDAADEAGAAGRTWAHDPELWVKMEFFTADPREAAARAACPLAFVRGAQSVLVDDEQWSAIAEIAAESARTRVGGRVGRRTPMISVPEARHHLMLDQPLAFVAALRGLFSAWPG